MPHPSMRILVGCLLAGSQLSCSTSPSTRKPVHANVQPLEVRLVTSGYDCRRNLTSIDTGLAAEVEDIAAALRSQDAHVSKPLRNPSSADLIANLGAEATGPVLWLYSGHADLVKPGTLQLLTDGEKRSTTRLADSVLCLRDGPHPIASFVNSLPRSAQFVLMIVNACFSADVDIRGAPVDMSLLSLSPHIYDKFTDNGRTVLGKAMRSLVLADLEQDCDGGLSDLELFARLQEDTKQQGYGSSMLKLRRQTHVLPNLAATKACHRDLPVEPHVVDLHVTTYTHYGTERAHVAGYIPKDLALTLDGKRVPPTQLNATGCRVDVGQCFQLLHPESGAQ